MTTERVPASIGLVLRRARSGRSLSLDQVAAHTRVSVRYLEALERDAPLEAYPAPVYARGFLRAYGRLLGLNADALVAEFERTRPAPDPATQEYVGSGIEGPGRLARWRAFRSAQL